MCLADWAKIHPTKITYEPDGHNKGCWFRDNWAHPNELAGIDVPDALKRLEPALLGPMPFMHRDELL